MSILGEKGLTRLVKYFLDLVFIGGIGIFISLPVSLKWCFDTISNMEGESYCFLLALLYITGFLALLILHEMRKIFKALDNRNPFIKGNVKSLKHISIASFVISASYVVKIFFFNSFLTVIIAMVFIMAGLFTSVLSDVFNQAVVVKEENDLTI